MIFFNLVEISKVSVLTSLRMITELSHTRLGVHLRAFCESTSAQRETSISSTSFPKFLLINCTS